MIGGKLAYGSKEELIIGLAPLGGNNWREADRGLWQQQGLTIGLPF